MGSIFKGLLAAVLVSTSATSFDPGGLEYKSEQFTLTINSDGSGELTVLYKDFGSKEDLRRVRKKELSYLKDSVMSNKLVAEASEDGVDIVDRRLDFDNYAIGAFVRAKSQAYGRLFTVFQHYVLEIEDMIYITPLNGVVGQASLSEGGKIVIRNNKYAFAWPTNTTNIQFTATYKIKGFSFRSENQ
ncbi:MAG: hypothetical protein OEZ55_01350 [Nitrospinota bacterium]|nr:hypothetical protein [Nitrospinota bacterium]MDH5755299.1 hypothetical protein [Nitrospinota bacterium]